MTGESRRKARVSVSGGLVVAALAATMALGGCVTRTTHHGYVLQEGALDQVPVGSSQEQVMLVLGTPSTTATVGGEAWYYISQSRSQTAFFDPQITDQRVLAVYFDDSNQVRQIANYGLQDGRVFDFISRETRTGGQDISLISQILGGIGRGTPFTR